MGLAAVSLRFPEADLEEIDRRAVARGLSRTAFLLAVALDDRFAQTAGEERLAQIEQRLDLLEAATFH